MSIFEWFKGKVGLSDRRKQPGINWGRRASDVPVKMMSSDMATLKADEREAYEQMVGKL